MCGTGMMYPCKPEERVGSPGAGVKDGCEVSGIKFGSFVNTASIFNH